MDMKEYNRQRTAKRQAWFQQAHETGHVVVGSGAEGLSSSGYGRSWDVYFPDGKWDVIHAHGPSATFQDGSWSRWSFKTQSLEVIEAIKLYEQRCKEEFQKKLEQLAKQTL